MTLRATLFILTCTLLSTGCGGSSSAEKPSEPEPTLTVPTIEFELDGERLLSDLNDLEIVAACEGMAAVLAAADEAIACQIVSAGSSDSSANCEAAQEACLKSPEEAMNETSVSTSPAPIDCSKFEAELVVGCDFPISMLEDCANAMGQSVVPAAKEVACSKAGSFADVAAANTAASQATDTAYVGICVELLACEALVATLIGGGNDSSDGSGGAGGNAQ